MTGIGFDFLHARDHGRLDEDAAAVAIYWTDGVSYIENRLHGPDEYQGYVIHADTDAARKAYFDTYHLLTHSAARSYQKFESAEYTDYLLVELAVQAGSGRFRIVDRRYHGLTLEFDDDEAEKLYRCLYSELEADKANSAKRD